MSAIRNGVNPGRIQWLLTIINIRCLAFPATLVGRSRTSMCSAALGLPCPSRQRLTSCFSAHEEPSRVRRENRIKVSPLSSPISSFEMSEFDERPHFSFDLRGPVTLRKVTGADVGADGFAYFCRNKSRLPIGEKR